MKENGSPLPEFETDEDRTFFLIRLPVHARADRGLAEVVAPQVAGQVAGQVSAEIVKLLFVLKGDMTRLELQQSLGLKGRANFEERYLKPALVAGMIELTIPDKPKSRKQKYRVSVAGKALIEQQERSEDKTNV